MTVESAPLENAWLVLLVALLAGYLVLGGLDYGTQLLRPFIARDGADRRATMAALGPFFFGNEVWLVAFAAVLLGAFPLLEGALLSGLYPVLVPLLAALVAGKAAVQLRGRARTARGVRGWDALITAGGAVPAVLWGTVVGVLLNGVEFTSGHAVSAVPALLSPAALLCTAAAPPLFAAHGASFTALRTLGPTASRARVLAGRLPAAAAAGAVLVGAAALATPAVAHPAAAAGTAALQAAALLGARAAARAGRTGAAFACTSAAMALFAVLPWAAHHPYVLASADGGGLTLSQAAADAASLAPLSWAAAVAVPLMAAYQAAGWWAFRGRVDGRTRSYL
ncbi:cytochrome d ubiquinol oxidase subunit II [Nocardiopsis baichengensis]|uniref:cytochrome d ubiquinol oxidase subunit II n=1 Tax=Nocardiopsis baichengensis TaxID=280240 RepID=UPI00037EE42C|nr:cytochrome d ubiquinol oxidase subunit II [Nocardiopsis baichengensis]